MDVTNKSVFCIQMTAAAVAVVLFSSTSIIHVQYFVHVPIGTSVFLALRFVPCMIQLTMWYKTKQIDHVIRACHVFWNSCEYLKCVDYQFQHSWRTFWSVALINFVAQLHCYQEY